MRGSGGVVRRQGFLRKYKRVSGAAFAVCLLHAPGALSAQSSMAAAIRSNPAASASLRAATPLSAGAVAPPATLEDALHGLFSAADVVFTGEVLSIERTSDAVVIRWQVEDAVRGADAGSVYSLREWPGLWEGNDARYFVGERALVMLHAPSAAGYASPVGGGDGVVPLHGNPPTGVLDLQLLAQRVMVTDAARLRPAQALRSAGGSLPLSDALQAQAAAAESNRLLQQRAARQLLALNETASQAVSTGPLPVASLTSSPHPNSRMDGAMILGMLHAWQGTRGSGK